MNVATHLHLVPTNRINCTMWYRMCNNLTFCLIFYHITPFKISASIDSWQGIISYFVNMQIMIIILYLSVFKCNAGLPKGLSQHAVPLISAAI